LWPRRRNLCTYILNPWTLLGAKWTEVACRGVLFIFRPLAYCGAGAKFRCLVKNSVVQNLWISSLRSTCMIRHVVQHDTKNRADPNFYVVSHETIFTNIGRIVQIPY
jgi:hypothetical protein